MPYPDIHVVALTLISILVTVYIQKRFDINVKVTTWIGHKFILIFPNLLLIDFILIKSVLLDMDRP